MTPAEIHALASEIASQTKSVPLWATFIIGLVVLSLLLFWREFLGQKAKNRAMLEDLKAITKAVRSVEHSFNLIETQFKARHDMRTACLAERLHVHQQAYVHYRSLLVLMNRPNAADHSSLEIEKWWENNCLFLDQEPRERFFKAVRMVSSHHSFRQAGDAETVKKDWEELAALGRSILKAASLPAIADEITNPAIA